MLAQYLYKKNFTCPHFAWAEEIIRAIQTSIHVYAYECIHTSTISHMYVWTWMSYEHTQARTHIHTHADINHPAAVRKRESWAVRRWLRGVGVFCSTDLLSPSLLLFFLLLLLLSSLQFRYTGRVQAAVLELSLRNLKRSNCASALTLSGTDWYCFLKHSCKFPFG